MNIDDLVRNLRSVYSHGDNMTYEELSAITNAIECIKSLKKAAEEIRDLADYDTYDLEELGYQKGLARALRVLDKCMSEGEVA